MTEVPTGLERVEILSVFLTLLPSANYCFDFDLYSVMSSPAHVVSVSMVVVSSSLEVSGLKGVLV